MACGDAVSCEERLGVPPPAWLDLLVVLAIVTMAAGKPVGIPLAGRTLPVGPTDAIVLLLVITGPFWYRRLPPLSPFTVSAGLFVLWAWASAALWSLDFRRSAMTSVALLQAAVVFVGGWHVALRGRGTAFIVAIRALNVLLVLQIAWVMWRTFADLQALGFNVLKEGVVTPLGSSNYLAVFLEFGLFFELLSRRRGWVPLALLNGAGIVLTLSRAAVVASAVALLITGIAVLGVRGQRRAALVVFGAAITGWVALVLTPLGQILAEAFSIVGRTAASRVSLWEDAWRAAMWRPATGVGFGAFETMGTMRNAHSTLFELLAELGVIGLALFTFALGAAFLRAARAGADQASGGRQTEAFGVAVGLGTVLLHSLVEPFFLGTSAVWTAAILAWVMGPWNGWPRSARDPAAAGVGAAPGPT